jgi:hypothetical protein
VATAWVKPWYPRGVDKPALGNPAHPATWVQGMSIAQKSWLVGRLDTQARYGTKVIVTGHWRNWTNVAHAALHLCDLQVLAELDGDLLPLAAAVPVAADALSALARTPPLIAPTAQPQREQQHVPAG